MNWVEYAEEDYLVARSTLRRKKPLTHSACFHAQQCAEKYLKYLNIV
jgi:HEPN domain-containing protein